MAVLILGYWYSVKEFFIQIYIVICDNIAGFSQNFSHEAQKKLFGNKLNNCSILMDS